MFHYNRSINRLVSLAGRRGVGEYGYVYTSYRRQWWRWRDRWIDGCAVYRSLVLAWRGGVDVGEWEGGMEGGGCKIKDIGWGGRGGGIWGKIDI